MKMTLKEVKQAVDTCMFTVIRFFDNKKDAGLIVFNNVEKEMVGRGIELIRKDGVATVKITNMGVVKAQKVIERKIRDEEIAAPFTVKTEIYRKVLIKEIGTLIFQNNFDTIFDCPEIREEVEREFEGEGVDTILQEMEKEKMDKLSTVLWQVYINTEAGENLEVIFQ
ncbi:hypothetical protein [Aeromonas phage AerS_266]|nr:hypothetical protein [Aeromonas phage AerS_266]